ncbi:MAG: hypothetical protein E5X43_37165 [Mesorhizobium sp.]|nr:MAG: hypothetical protein E5X61_30010 [Mesorhizobium sp.]TJW63759.1 MAG: hypothetical protein E5X43_37165 [Mesorhizobium sp.]
MSGLSGFPLGYGVCRAPGSGDRLGRRQLVGLAQLVVRDQQVLLLEEPTRALEMRRQLEMRGVQPCL